MIYRNYGKRLLDLFLALALLIILSPVFCLLAVSIRISLGSPVIFRQRRPGRNEKMFTLYKFRTMADKADALGRLLPDSERLTGFGRFLKSTSLDELPELINILRGDMSFIGPRPLLARYLPYYREEERLRHLIRPGLSGLAQIHGRNYLGWDKWLAYDVQYVNTVSLFLDLKIIVKTLRKVLYRDGFAVTDLLPLKDLDEERSNFLWFGKLSSGDFSAHKEEIKAFLIALYETNYPSANLNSKELGEEKVNQLEHYIETGKAVLFGVIKQSELIGFLWAFPYELAGEARLHVNQFIVASKYRGMGIGTRLLQEAEDYAFEAGIPSVDLFVAENNTKAMEFYEASGYKTERRGMKKKLFNRMGE